MQTVTFPCRAGIELERLNKDNNKRYIDLWNYVEEARLHDLVLKHLPLLDRSLTYLHVGLGIQYIPATLAPYAASDLPVCL